MNQNELFSYVYDFISQITENKKLFEVVNRIILFGSVARGDFTRESDIDIFFDLNLESEEANKLIKKEIDKFETRAERTWYIRGIKLPIKTLAGKLEDARWADLKEEILAYGKILYGKFEQPPSKIKHKLLITYELSKLKQHRKMSLIRKLYGYKIKKGTKEYMQEGVIEKTRSLRFGTNSLIIEPENLINFKQLLKNHKVKYKMIDIWTK